MANHYTAALSQAKSELKSLNAEIQRLQARKGTLENLVKTLSSLSMNYETDQPTRIESNDAEERLARAGIHPIPMNTDGPTYLAEMEYLWQQIARLMKDAPSFTISQAGEAVEKATGRSLGHTRSQQIRNALVRRTGVFRRNEDGTWTVIKEVSRQN